MTLVILAALAAAYLTIAAQVWTGANFAQLWAFTGLGVAGALIANSTGVGGGAVFVPAFSFLRETGLYDLSHMQVVGLSFAIQSFGMTIGSLTWVNRIARDRAAEGLPGIWPRVLTPVLALSLAASLPAMLVTQWAITVPDGFGFLAFKIFSITLGGLLLFQVLRGQKHHHDPHTLTGADRLGIVIFSALGGVATAWFSVGIGEILALYLFLRGFDMRICAPAAVIVSAVSVVVGSGYHWAQAHIALDILLFAAPGVALGGFLARRLAYWLGATRLKLLASIWIIASSLVLIALR
jgi:uncharacterized membrane protein YfcA